MGAIVPAALSPSKVPSKVTVRCHPYQQESDSRAGSGHCRPRRPRQSGLQAEIAQIRDFGKTRQPVSEGKGPR
jgi:hypothetical protein